MKIAQVTTFFHPVTGGVETHVLELARALIAEGHEVEVLTSDSNKAGPRISEKRTEFLKVPVRRFRVLLNLSPYHRFYPGLFFYLLRSDADIIHVHGFRKIEVYLALAVKILRRGKVKLIVTGHNPFPTNSRRIRFNALVKLHDSTIGKVFSRSIDRVIALVKSEAQRYSSEFNVPAEKIVIIPNGFSEEYLEPGDANRFYHDWNIKPDSWQAIASGLGRINKAKGFQLLRTAVQKNKKVLFFIAGGDDGYMAKLKFELGSYRNVIFSERFLPPVKIRDMFAASDMFLFPSLHEAFGIVLLEALACGVPVISTNVGGPAEFVKPGFGMLLDPKDEQAWSDAVAALASDPAKRDKMSAEGMRFAKRFTWGKISRKVAEVYSEIIPHVSTGTETTK